MIIVHLRRPGSPFSIAKPKHFLPRLFAALMLLALPAFESGRQAAGAAAPAGEAGCVSGSGWRPAYGPARADIAGQASRVPQFSGRASFPGGAA